MRPSTLHMIRAGVLALILTGCACESDSPENPGIPVATCRPLLDYLHTTAIIPCDGATACGTDGKFLYVGSDDPGLGVFDISDPTDPVARGTVDTTGTPVDIDVVGERVYVAWGNTGVVIVDAGDPDRPVIVGAVPTPGSAVGIAVEDSCAFVADNVIGLLVIDIRVPESPRVLGVENTPGVATGVAVASPVALVSDATLGLRVVNVADPTRPFLVRAVPTPGKASGVVIAGSRGYVADGMAGLHVVTLGGAILTTRVTAGLARGVAADERVACVFEQILRGPPQTTQSGVEVFDLGRSDDPVSINRIETTGNTLDVSARAGRLVTADGSAGARVIDVERPGSPPSRHTLLGAGDDIRDVEAFGSHLLVADAASGLVVARGEGGRPVAVASWAGVAAPVDIAVWGDTAFVSDGVGAVSMVDLSDVTGPVPAGEVPGSQGTIGMNAHGGVLYMARGINAFVSWATDGLSAPATASLQAFATASAVSGNLVYVVTRQRFFVRTAPDLQPANSTPEFGTGETIEICVIDDGVFPRPFAFVGVSAGGPGVGVAVLDLFGLAFPTLVNHVPTAAAPLDVAIRDHVLYVSQGNGGLELFDISDLRDIRPAGFFPGRQTILRTAFDGASVFAAAATDGIFSTASEPCTGPGN